jgi:hypothetical protein
MKFGQFKPLKERLDFSEYHHHDDCTQQGRRGPNRNRSAVEPSNSRNSRRFANLIEQSSRNPGIK